MLTPKAGLARGAFLQISCWWQAITSGRHIAVAHTPVRTARGSILRAKDGASIS